MSLNLNVSSSAFVKRIDLSSLPVTHVDKGAKALGIFLVFFAVVWGGVPTAMLISAMASGKFDPDVLFLLIFTVVGAGLLIGGVNVLLSSTTTTLDRHSVRVAKKSLFGSSVWSEQLSAYQGVLSRSEYHRGSKNSPAYTLYIVELRHPEPKKTVRLYEARSDQGVRAIWEDCCRRLGLPAVEKDGAEWVRRDVADLDKSVKELVKEGKVKVEFDLSKPPPSGLSLRVDGDVLEFTIVRKKSSAVGFGIALLVSLVLMYVGFLVKQGPLILGLIGAVLFAVFMASLFWARVAKDQIRIGREEIRTRQVTPWGIAGDRGVRSAQIETVRIGKQHDQGREAVLLETDAGTVAIGAGLSSDSLEWLKNCILRAIST